MKRVVSSWLCTESRHVILTNYLWMWLCLNTFLVHNDTNMVTVAIITTRPHMNIHDVKFAFVPFTRCCVKLICLYNIGWRNKVNSLFWLFTYLKRYKSIAWFLLTKQDIQLASFFINLFANLYILSYFSVSTHQSLLFFKCEQSKVASLQ